MIRLDTNTVVQANPDRDRVRPLIPRNGLSIWAGQNWQVFQKPADQRAWYDLAALLLRVPTGPATQGP